MKLSGKIVEHTSDFEPALKNGRRMPRIWVVVADHGIARIFSKPGGHLELIGEALPDETMQVELTNKTIGRVTGTGHAALHHKYEPHMEQARQDAVIFAKEFVGWLAQAEAKHMFDRLVIVAAPRMLGEMRQFISLPLQNRIVAEVNKDLTKLDEDSLRQALDKILWF